MNSNKQDKPPWYKDKGCLLAFGIYLFLLFFFVIPLARAIIRVRKEASSPTYYERAIDFPFDSLPDSAHDIRFKPYKTFSAWGRFYEFKCTERDYRDWVSENKIIHPELSPITQQKDRECPSISKDGIVGWNRINDLLISSWNFEDSGIYFIYDLDEGRAIRHSQSR